MTRKWFKYSYSKYEINTNDRFRLTDFHLIDTNKNYQRNFNFDTFLKNELCRKIYNFLNNNLINEETLFLGSSWGWWEYFLQEKFKLIASDINDQYISYHKKNTNLEYQNIDILNENELENLKNKYLQIVVNNIEYLFDDNQLSKSIQNISKISKKGSRIIVIFRSRDGLIQRIIDNFLSPLETFIIYLFRINKKDYNFTKYHHGYRRKIENFINFWKKNNFNLEYLYEDMHELEYSRLKTIEKLKFSKIISRLLLKKAPYLNIIVFKNNKKD